jgi:hypothetical protein
LKPAGPRIQSYKCYSKNEYGLNIIKRKLSYVKWKNSRESKGKTKNKQKKIFTLEDKLLQKSQSKSYTDEKYGTSIKKDCLYLCKYFLLFHLIVYFHFKNYSAKSRLMWFICMLSYACCKIKEEEITTIPTLQLYDDWLWLLFCDICLLLMLLWLSNILVLHMNGYDYRIWTFLWLKL